MFGKVFIPFHIASLVKEKASYKRPQKHVHVHVVTNFKLCQNKKAKLVSRNIHLLLWPLEKANQIKGHNFQKVSPRKRLTDQ